MKIVNLKKNKTLAKDYVVCGSAFSKAMGLRFRTSINTLVFPMKIPQIVVLDMLFVFFPIDVLFLNKEMKVIEIKEDFRPFKIYVSRKKASYVVELPRGIIGKTRTNIGDKLSLGTKNI